MYEYLVTCKNRKKLIRIATREELKPRVSSLFDIPLWAIRTHMYVETFNDYVDIDDFDDVPSSCKLTITDMRDDDSLEAGTSSRSASSTSTVKVVDAEQM